MCVCARVELIRVLDAPPTIYYALLFYFCVPPDGMYSIGIYPYCPPDHTDGALIINTTTLYNPQVVAV